MDLVYLIVLFNFYLVSQEIFNYGIPTEIAFLFSIKYVIEINDNEIKLEFQI